VGRRGKKNSSSRAEGIRAQAARQVKGGGIDSGRIEKSEHQQPRKLFQTKEQIERLLEKGKSTMPLKKRARISYKKQGQLGASRTNTEGKRNRTTENERTCDSRRKGLGYLLAKRGERGCERLTSKSKFCCPFSLSPYLQKRPQGLGFCISAKVRKRGSEDLSREGICGTTEKKSGWEKK